MGLAGLFGDPLVLCRDRAHEVPDLPDFRHDAAFLHASATALGAYGAGKVASGHDDIVSILELALGLVVLVLLFQRFRLRRRAVQGEPPGAGAAQAERVTGVG
jgi:hypothetical protein